MWPSRSPELGPPSQPQACRSATPAPSCGDRLPPFLPARGTLPSFPTHSQPEVQVFDRRGRSWGPQFPFQGFLRGGGRNPQPPLVSETVRWWWLFRRISVVSGRHSCRPDIDSGQC